MENWPILSYVVNYVQYSRHPRNYYDLDIHTIDQKSQKKIYGKEEDSQISKLDFDDAPK